MRISLWQKMEAVNEGDAVTVTAFITYIGGGISADLVYSAGGAAEVTVPMTGAETGGDFVGVIPAQPYDCPVEFRVVAKNKDGYTSETKGKYTVGDVPQDYTKLRLNELNGNDKFIEIYNAGDQKIKLQGVYIQKEPGGITVCPVIVGSSGAGKVQPVLCTGHGHKCQSPLLLHLFQTSDLS